MAGVNSRQARGVPGTMLLTPACVRGLKPLQELSTYPSLYCTYCQQYPEFVYRVDASLLPPGQLNVSLCDADAVGPAHFEVRQKEVGRGQQCCKTDAWPRPPCCKGGAPDRRVRACCAEPPHRAPAFAPWPPWLCVRPVEPSGFRRTPTGGCCRERASTRRRAATGRMLWRTSLGTGTRTLWSDQAAAPPPSPIACT